MRNALTTMSKDHFVPQFYLRRWATNGTLSSAKWIKAKKKLHWKQFSPAAIGYQEELYGDNEQHYFMPLDTRASEFTAVFDKFDGNISYRRDLTDEQAELWAKYLLAQLVRTPENVAAVCQRFKSEGFNDDIAKSELKRIIENGRAIRDIQDMLWIYKPVSAEIEIITSDNPLIFKPSNLSHENCVLILPMSPNSYFLATHHENLKRLPTRESDMVRSIN